MHIDASSVYPRLKKESNICEVARTLDVLLAIKTYFHPTIIRLTEIAN